MTKYVECVPNFSEGKDAGKIDAIVAAAGSAGGVIILDVEKDADHNRTVLSFLSPVESAAEACFRAAKTAAELIDLNVHRGAHPRMGAMDVIPFIPVLDSTVEDCIGLARQLGERIGNELQIPVYLYDLAAMRPERSDLAKVRKGQFEGLKEEIGSNPAKVPDFGPNRIHPTAGAVAVGAREQIVNFNVNLDTADMELGKELAKKIRASGGGLPFLRAKEIFLESLNQVQISTVLTNYKVTSLKTVLSEIQSGIAQRGIRIVNTELIGLVPQGALTGLALETLNAGGFHPEEQILENRLNRFFSGWQTGALKFIGALAEPAPTPGGGSAGAVAGAMGCALSRMAIAITLQSKKTDPASLPALEKASESFKAFQVDINACISEDARAFELFMETRKLPKDNPDRDEKMQNALKYAAEVPLKTAGVCAEALKQLRSISEIVSSAVKSDYRCAAHLFKAGIKCSEENVKINLQSIKDEAFCDRLSRTLIKLKSHLGAAKD